MKTKTEYANFANLTTKLMKVPHSEIKAKLEEEKKEKAERKQKRTKTG